MHLLSHLRYDGNPFNDNLKPKLTTITQPLEEIAKQVVTKLISIIEDDDKTIVDIKVKPKLTLGDTTKSCN